MQPFDIFFTFYGLLLGLAAAEVLSGVGAFTRERPLRSMELQSALLAFLIFLVICATWIDAYAFREAFDLSFASMACPVAAATAYYLSAVVVLPRDKADYDAMDGYFLRKKRFIITMLVIAELALLIIALPRIAEDFQIRPAIFWLLRVPMTFLVFGGWALLFIVQRRRAVIAALLIQIAVFTIPYWSQSWISRTIRATYGYV
jgi:hypothetical protein